MRPLSAPIHTDRVVQSGAQHAQVLPGIAQEVAAAVHAQQIPVEDLVGFLNFANPVERIRVDKGRPEITQASARLVLERFVDAAGVRPCHPSQG